MPSATGTYDVDVAEDGWTLTVQEGPDVPMLLHALAAKHAHAKLLGLSLYVQHRYRELICDILMELLEAGFWPLQSMTEVMDSLAEPPIDEDEISWCAARIRETTRALIARAQGSPPKIQALQEAGLLLEDEAPLRA